MKAQRMTLSAFSFLLCCLLCEVEVGFNAARSQMRYSTYYSLFTRVEFFMYQVKDERPAITSSSSISILASLVEREDLLISRLRL